MIPDISFVSVATLIGVAFIIWLILVVFFTPGMNYHVVEARQDACSPEFSYTLVATSQAVFYHGNRIQVLTNGATFYPAMLEAIKAATRSVNLECYIFHPGTIADQFIEALRIFEYEQTMTHAKVLVVDETWGVLGTTNIDNRSFEHNDEVNIVMRDEGVARRLIDDYQRDVGDSCEITLEAWRGRPRWEKIIGTVAWILERQQ